MNIKKWIIYFFPLLFTFAAYAQPATSTPSDAKKVTPPPANTQTTAPSPSEAKDKFPATLNLGGIEWKLGNEQQDKDVHLAEYVSNNENVNNWTQLVTFQKFKFIFPKEVTPSKFAEGEFSQLQKQGYKLKTSIIESSPDQAIMEFRIEEPTAEQQDELQRIIKTTNGQVLVFHYVIKKSDMGAAERSKWITALKGIDMPFLMKNDEVTSQP